MNCIEFFRRAGWACGLAALCVAWPGSAPAIEQAGPHPAESSWPESDTVLDLLHADAQAAAGSRRLERAQDWLAMPAGMAPPHVPPHAVPGSRAEPAGDARDRLDVMAIYGVGQSLHADVAINGELWRYRQGRLWPQGIDDAAGEPRYSLVRIDQPCVRLRWQEAQRTACLHRGERRDD
jgi:hypothetical protein